MIGKLLCFLGLHEYGQDVKRVCYETVELLMKSPFYTCKRCHTRRWLGSER